MSTKTNLKKLAILLPHWLGHNQSHLAEFEKWQEIARQEGQTDIAGFIATAITHMQAADQALVLAQNRLDPAGHHPDSNHHHHDD